MEYDLMHANQDLNFINIRYLIYANQDLNFVNLAIVDLSLVNLAFVDLAIVNDEDNCWCKLCASVLLFMYYYFLDELSEIDY